MAYKQKEKISLLIYYDYKEQFDLLTDEQLRKIIYAMIEFDKTGKEPELDQFLKMAFVPIKKRLILDKKNWENVKKRNQQNIKKRWENNGKVYDGIQPYTTVYDSLPEFTKNTDIDIDIDKDKGIEKEKEKDRECESKLSHNIDTFVSPTLTEIISYSHSLDFNDDEYCEKFYNHYESIGWVNGAGREIKNWKLIFKNWLKKDKKENEFKIDTSRRLG